MPKVNKKNKKKRTYKLTSPPEIKQQLTPTPMQKPKWPVTHPNLSLEDLPLTLPPWPRELESP